jgi:anti-anti-sigma factor
MLPRGVEVRSLLQVRSDVLAFGFTGERIAEEVVVGLLGGEFLDYIMRLTERSLPGLIVLDMRNVVSLPSTGLACLLSLRKRLSRAGWKLILVINDPILRQVFATANLDRVFVVAATEAQLRALINGVPPGSPQSPAHQAVEFTPPEIAQMEAASLTLDDAIRAVEGLRR